MSGGSLFVSIPIFCILTHFFRENKRKVENLVFLFRVTSTGWLFIMLRTEIRYFGYYVTLYD